ncbi:helix-turn-helix transcriptional regulator [Desulfosporosinus sp. Sb-LF]|uniref:helix-turn-helix domain-containing protein n=1 Tax=Desulfosporosinus sp. Sb-LF TaxID=2560027 RepID=UPI00130516FB|nr:helix-turn-helix transcriptional regulator [Desulfosporosinus sp. Sb-LF]
MKEKILEKGITYEELALGLGITVKTLNLKLSKRSRITIQDAEDMSKILNIENPSNIFFASQS